jgi:hypothetical protein
MERREGILKNTVFKKQNTYNKVINNYELQKIQKRSPRLHEENREVACSRIRSGGARMGHNT